MRFSPTMLHEDKANNGNEMAQQFCLRWNNHSSNFISVLEHLLKVEAFTDVTISSADGQTAKAHKMVLAACSTYFEQLFINNSNDHTIVVLSDVKYDELKTILDYMYKGEVNVLQDDLPELLRAAGYLQVKGLVGNETLTEPILKREEVDNSRSSPPPVNHIPMTNGARSNGGCISPNHTTNYMPSYHKSPQIEKNQNHMPYWNGLTSLGLQPVSSHKPRTHHHPMLGSSYENASETSPLSRKKQSIHMLANSTPILRNVLGQNQVEPPQPMAVDQPERPLEGSFCSNSNGSANDLDRRNSAEFSISEDERRMSPTTTGIRLDSSYGSSNQRKPEWKRYKQYTQQNIKDAIAAVQNKKMSALQAAKYYKVPSRTLYDKLKKAGFVPSRGAGVPRHSGGVSLESSARFPYSSGINGHVYGSSRAGSCSGAMSESDTETNGYPGEPVYTRDAELLAAIANENAAAVAAAAAAAAVPAAPAVPYRPETNSPDEAMDMSRHSPSPVAAAALARAQPEPPSVDDDEVEDLSVARTNSTPTPSEHRLTEPAAGPPIKKEAEEEEIEDAESRA